MKFSPLSFGATLILHCTLFLCAMISLHQRDNRNTTKQFIQVSLLTTTPSTRSDLNLPDLSDNVVTPESLIQSEEKDQPIVEDHYYLPEELSQQVVVIKDDTGDLNIPIRQIVVMALYINEAGHVDQVELEDKGTLSEEEQQQLIAAFKEIVFLPGMRGAKLVKALYRIQLKINRRLTIHY